MLERERYVRMVTAPILHAIEEKMDQILFLLDGNYLVNGEWMSRKEILGKNNLYLYKKGLNHVA